MIFKELPIAGAFLIEPEPIRDGRGFFARMFCQHEFAEHGLHTGLVQCSTSFNRQRGTLRGMHYQRAPHAEAKLVRCTQGRIYDVILDLRPGSNSYVRWASIELSAQNRHMLYIPEGVAHGFMTLEDDSEVFYQMSEYYYPECAAGIRWNDPFFRIEWPALAPVIAQKDTEYSDYRPGGGHDE